MHTKKPPGHSWLGVFYRILKAELARTAPTCIGGPESKVSFQPSTEGPK